MIECKRCQSASKIKNGVARGKPRYKCKSCGYNFVEGDGRFNESLVIKKALAVMLYSLGQASFGMLGKIFGVDRSLTYRWVRDAAKKLPDPVVGGDIREMEFDEMWHFVGSKKTKDGSLKPWIVAKDEVWPGLSGRDAATFRRLYEQVKHLEKCIFYTDDWKGFGKVLPKDRHVIGKTHTTTIERDNSHTRHHLGRMTRRTKVVSKKEAMIEASMKLWHALTDQKTLINYQNTFLSIFK